MLEHIILPQQSPSDLIMIMMFTLYDISGNVAAVSSEKLKEDDGRRLSRQSPGSRGPHFSLFGVPLQMSRINEHMNMERVRATKG